MPRCAAETELAVQANWHLVLGACRMDSLVDDDQSGGRRFNGYPDKVRREEWEGFAVIQRKRSPFVLAAPTPSPSRAAQWRGCTLPGSYHTHLI